MLRRARRGVRFVLPFLGLLLTAMVIAGCAEFQRPDEAIAIPAGAVGRRVTVASGRRVYVESRGQGSATPVLLVHGFASNRETWSTVEPALRSQRRTIAVDLPGFGFSDRTAGDYAPEALADDLASVLDRVGVDQVDLVAHSWGCSVSLAFALRHPARVRRMVLLGAWAFDEQIPPFFRWARESGVGEALFELFYRERLEDRAPLGFAEGTTVPQSTVDAIERSLERPGTLRAALAAVRGQYFLHLERQYPQVVAPTLVVYGDEDRVALPRYGARLANALADARLVTIARAGHFPMFESAGTVRGLILGFLDGPRTEEPRAIETAEGARFAPSYRAVEPAGADRSGGSPPPPSALPIAEHDRERDADTSTRAGRGASMGTGGRMTTHTGDVSSTPAGAAP
jgi:pimeloyl-ACP methyl ester carboxylesterase